MNKKRNYQKQSDNLEEARMIRNLRMNREGNGRIIMEDLQNKKVKEYIAKNPDDNPITIAIRLGISRTTVYKYLC